MIQLEALPDCAGVAGKRVAPECVAEHHGAAAAHVARLKGAAASGGNAQHSKEIFAYGNREDITRRSATRHGCACSRPRRESYSLKAPGVPGELLKIGIRAERLRKVRVFHAGVEHVHQARRIFIGKRLEDHAADHAEYRGIGADPEGQSENYNRRESRRLAQEAPRVAKVL